MALDSYRQTTSFIELSIEAGILLVWEMGTGLKFRGSGQFWYMKRGLGCFGLSFFCYGSADGTGAGT